MLFCLPDSGTGYRIQPFYLEQGRFSPESWSSMIKHSSVRNSAPRTKFWGVTPRDFCSSVRNRQKEPVGRWHKAMTLSLTSHRLKRILEFLFAAGKYLPPVVFNRRKQYSVKKRIETFKLYLCMIAKLPLTSFEQTWIFFSSKFLKGYFTKHVGMNFLDLNCTLMRTMLLQERTINLSLSVVSSTLRKGCYLRFVFHDCYLIHAVSLFSFLVPMNQSKNAIIHTSWLLLQMRGIKLTSRLSDRKLHQKSLEKSQFYRFVERGAL